MVRASFVFSVVFSGALLLVFPVTAEVVSTNDSMACPSISQITQFTKTFRTPSSCIEFPTGRTFKGPFDEKMGGWFDSQRKFYLIEVPGRGRMWTPAVWSKIVASGHKTPGLPDSVSKSPLWFARLLRDRFPNGVPLHGITYPLEDLLCHSSDITKFEVSASRQGGGFAVEGSVSLGSIRAPFHVLDRAQGKKYMLLLQAYLFSPSGELVWSQNGFPIGDAWVKSTGDLASFRLINTLPTGSNGKELVVVAAGDPVLSKISETRVLLGAKRIELP